MKKVVLIITVVTINYLLIGQDINIPENYSFSNSEDYKKYEQSVIECINWIIITPKSENNDTRKKANKFIRDWLKDNPHVDIKIESKILNFQQDMDNFTVFTGGWAKYVLESKDSDIVNCHVAAIESVLEYYKNSNLTMDTNLKKYKKQQKKGELKEYVKKIIE